MELTEFEIVFLLLLEVVFVHELAQLHHHAALVVAAVLASAAFAAL